MARGRRMQDIPLTNGTEYRGPKLFQLNPASVDFQPRSVFANS